MNAASKVTSKGQVTIPKRVREALHICPGDRVSFELKDDKATIAPHVPRPIGNFVGVFRSDSEKVTDEKISETAKSAAMRRYARSRNQ